MLLCFRVSCVVVCYCVVVLLIMNANEYLCSVEAVKRFLKENKLTSVIRAHEAQVDG